MAAQREWFEKDYYGVLGVAETARRRRSRRAYRKLARQYHPDANPGDATAEERFKEVSAAYDVVGDADKRKEYDEVRRLGPGASAGFPGGRRAAGMRRLPVPGAAATSATCSATCSAGGGRRGGGAAAVDRTAGQDLEAELHLTFDDAAAGRHHHGAPHQRRAVQHLPRHGAEPGTTPRTCGNCGGRGVVDDNQGMFSLLLAVPGVRRAGASIIERPVPDLPRHRRRAPAPRGQGAHPRRASTTASASG